ncbi:MAG: lipoate--protein ligase family protein [Chloroflexota bacterium]|nr:lipoate--protein ligase family protein [Chloroflexota bacterium]
MWRQWRLIGDSPAIGAYNMAVDEAILRRVAAGEQPPTLRLYAWHPPCLSLGYGQRAREVDFERLAARGWNCVRRMTGGRAILHTDELTYSLTLPLAHPLAQQDVVESYRQISEALLSALRALGAQPAADKLAEGVKSSDPVCFETPSHYEITVDGRKLVGSAQARKHGGLLQHGTLPLTGDIARICDVLVYIDEAARVAAKTHIRSRALTLADALGRSVSWGEVAETVAVAFRETFAIELEQTLLSDEEQQAAAIIARDVYGAEDWTFRR